MRASDMHASDGGNCLTGGLPLRLCCPLGLLLGINLTLVRADVASLQLCSSLQNRKHAMGQAAKGAAGSQNVQCMNAMGPLT